MFSKIFKSYKTIGVIVSNTIAGNNRKILIPIIQRFQYANSESR